MKDHETDDHRLDEKEDSIELVVTFIACDCSGHEAGEVKAALAAYCGPSSRKWRVPLSKLPTTSTGVNNAKRMKKAR